MKTPWKFDWFIYRQCDPDFMNDMPGSSVILAYQAEMSRPDTAGGAVEHSFGRHSLILAGPAEQELKIPS
jgi:hypothetical protein